MNILGGESSGGRQTRNGVAVCSQKTALLVAGVVLGTLLLTALIIAFAGPQSGKFSFFLCKKYKKAHFIFKTFHIKSIKFIVLKLLIKKILNII